MTDELENGQTVKWNSHGGEAHGTDDDQIAQGAASKSNPEFIVETDNGSRAAHTAGALKKDGS